MGFTCMLGTQYDQLPADWIAQLVEHCIGIVEDIGCNPIPSVKILSGFDFTAAQIVLNDHSCLCKFLHGSDMLSLICLQVYSSNYFN